MIEGRTPDWRKREDAVTLDDFYRRALAQGLSYHDEQQRGLLPAGLLEEIRALDRPPIPWDVELARWFDDHFPAAERRRSYARISRRQSATPDIPRPRYVPAPDDETRTFAVVLDTSGSMNRALLAKLQPGIDLLEKADDFPAAGPILVITDGYCDRVRITREHAFLLPQGNSLPFVPKGKVFGVR